MTRIRYLCKAEQSVCIPGRVQMLWLGMKGITKISVALASRVSGE